MKEKVLYLLLLLMSISGLHTLRAQSLVVRMHNGADNPELISSIQKLHFENGKLMVSLKAGNTSQYELSEIQKLYFGTVTSITETELSEKKLSVFPNPALQDITIQNIPSGTSMIYIYRNDGKLIMKTGVFANTETIAIAQLQSGFYILVANNQIVKFIKL